MFRFEMTISYDDAHQIFIAEKRLLKPRTWSTVPKGNSNAEMVQKFESRVLIDTAVPRGVFFRILIHPASLTNVVFMLDCDSPSGRTNVALYRFELEPIRPHINKLWGPEDINGLRIAAGVTHEHLFYDCVTQDGKLRTRTDLQARIVEEPPEDFSTALDYVCRRTNIINGGDVPTPRAQGQLL